MNLLRKLFFAISVLAAFVLLAPVIVVYSLHIAWNCYREQKHWRRFARQYREAIIQPIAFQQVDPDVQLFIKLLEPEIESLGFGRVDDYMYKGEPLKGQFRVYLSDARKTVLAVGHYDVDISFSLTSLTSNGRVIETCAVECVVEQDWLADSTEYFVQTFDIDTVSLQEIAEHHHSQCQIACEKFNEDMVALSQEQVPAALKYENRKYAQLLHQNGRLDGDVPQPIWPLDLQRPSIDSSTLVNR